MAKKILSVLLTLLIVFSSINMTVFASTTPSWTKTVISAVDHNVDYESGNCSSYYYDWDQETGVCYKHYVSVENKSTNRNLYIGRWGMNNIISEHGNKFYVAMYVRTNSASTPKYAPMNFKDANSGGISIPSASIRTAAENAFKGNEEWEFNYIEFDFSQRSEAIHLFQHGQLDFYTADGCYLDLAAWGIFAPTVSKDDAKAALIASATLADNQVYTVTCKNRDDSTLKTYNISSKLNAASKKIVLPVLEDSETERFIGWAETKDATTATIIPGAEYTPSADIVFYPVYTTVPLHNVTFKVDGEEFAEFSVKEDSNLIFPTTYPEKEGKYFAGWDKDITVMGNEDIVLNATFVDKAEVGVHYYWNGESETEGDGSINRPFKMFKKLIEATNATGGVVIVAGKSAADQYHVKATNKDDITFTSVDPLTGHDYRGALSADKNSYSGASFYVTSGSIYWGGAAYQTGKITFKDIDILNRAGQYGQASFNFDGHPFEIGENVNNYVSDNGTDLNWKLTDMFIGAAGPNNLANIKTAKAVFRTKQTGANWLMRGGASSLDSVDYELYAKTFINFCQNGADVATVNGPVRFTFYNGSTDSKIYHSRESYAFGSKAYASIILNSDVTITNQLDVSEETGLNNKVYIIKSSADGVVTHTEAKGTYKVDSETMNYAQIYNAQNVVVDEGIIDGNLELTVPDFGEYHIVYSERSVYSAEYITSPYDDVAPTKYSVTSDDTANHKITLPIVERQNAHKFLGWTTTEGGTTVEYEAGEEYTLTGKVKFYAVWEDIPSSTITFKDDNGEIIEVFDGYVGSPITFPTKLMYKYGQKFLGYAYEGTTDVLDENSTMPETPKVAVPVWSEIPANETRIYVNAETGKSTNSGISPDMAVDTIATAVNLLKTSGGYIIVTGGTNQLSGDWNNSGDITVTSFDPVTKIDYKAKEISDDGLSFKSGAVIAYNSVAFGTSTTTGKITFNNISLLNKGEYQYINFNAHPFELGEGISVYQKTGDDKAITKNMLHIRAMGEINSINTNPDGIKFTINSVDGNIRIFTIGKAATVVPNMEITVDSAYQGNLIFGNDSGGAGKATVKGDIKFILNGSITKKPTFASNYTNPVEGNIYVLCNDNSSGDLSGINQAEGYGLYKVTTDDTAKLSFGDSKGEIVITRKEGNNYKFAKIVDSAGYIIDYVDISSGSGSFIPSEFDSYEITFTDESYHRITFETGDPDIMLSNIWCKDGSDIEIAKELYRYGYIFEGWTDGENTYDEGLITMPSKHITLTAVWSVAPKYTVTFDANGSDIKVPQAVTDYVNENVELEKVLSNNSSFIGWSEDKNAKTGALNHVITKDTTLYAITTTEPTYIIDTHFRGSPYDNTSSNSASRRYIIDVYLENATASSGKFKLNTNNRVLFCMGHIPLDGITATIKKEGSNGYVEGVPGLQYSTTSSIEFTWESDKEINAQNGRRKIARIMMAMSYWGAGYQNIEVLTTDQIVSPYAGYTSLIDGEQAFMSANFFDGIKTEELKTTGKVELLGTPATGSTNIYILDNEGDAVDYYEFDNSKLSSNVIEYSTQLYPGEYNIKVLADGYKEATIPASFDGQAELPTVPVFVDETEITETITSTTETIADMKYDSWKISVDNGVISYYGGSQEAIEVAKLKVLNDCMSGDVYTGPKVAEYTRSYNIDDVLIRSKSLKDYKIVIKQGDSIALKYAQYIKDYVIENIGFDLPIVYDSEAATALEIVVGNTTRLNNPVTEIEKYITYEEDGRLYVFYGDEQGGEIASEDLCTKILGTKNESFNDKKVTVAPGMGYEGAWSVLTRYGVTSDTHVGVGKNWSNYDWLHSTFDNYEKIHKENPLDFIVNCGDILDNGYADTYATDYAIYLEEIKNLKICDPVNPIDGRAEGMIPYYEICGNHDPVGGTYDTEGNFTEGKIRFFKNNFWYTENADGDKTAHIAFFTDYGGYPLYENKYSGSTESYYSYGVVNDEMLKYVENSIIAANEAGAKHIMLYNHYAISQEPSSPILPETGLAKIASLCKKYNIELYFNGHEHNNDFTLFSYDGIYDYDISMTAVRHAVVELTTRRAKVTIYNKDGSIYREDLIPLSGSGANDTSKPITPDCQHQYTDCEDTKCNLCGEDRVAPGHSFTNYVANNDATCTEDGTKTAVCDYGCGKKDTIADVGTKHGHKFTDEADATCDYGCGFVRPRGPELVEENGVTYYYYNGVKSTATGLVEYNGKTMYINKGRFLGASGLVTIDGKKLYIRNGYFLGASGLVTINGKKHYIRNGYFLGASGLVTINGKKHYVRNGIFLGATGLVTINGKKHYVRNGIFLGATGLVTISGKKHYVRNGIFLGATGIVTLDGKKLYIRNGYFLGASGTVTVGGKKYKVVKGIVQ